MKLRHIALAAIVLFSAAFASAAVTPIAEFTGEAFEGFEGIIPPGSYSGPMPIFAATGTFDDNFTDPWIANSLFSGSGDQLFPYNGNLMGLAPTGWTNFTFDTPAYRFGGFFGTVNDATGGNVTFYDELGAPIETLPFALPLAAWMWNGWESDVAFSSVSVHTGANPGFTGVYDDLQISYVPEPGALTLLAVGTALFLRRR